MVQQPWHVELTDGEYTIKAQCCDPVGKVQSVRYIERAPLERTSMKLGQGRTQYSDLVPPWYSISQDDYSGGRGGKRQLDDPTKYWDGNGVQAWIPRRMVLGPAKHNDATWWQTYGRKPPDYDAINIPAETAPFGQTFTPHLTTTIDKLYIYYDTADANGMKIYCTLCGASGGKPDQGNELSAGQSAILTGAAKGWLEITLPIAATIEAGTEYSIIVYLSSSGSGTINLWGHAVSQFVGAAYQWNIDTWDAHATIADFSIKIPMMTTGAYGPEPDTDALITAAPVGYDAQTLTPENTIKVTEIQVYLSSSVGSVGRYLMGYIWTTSGGEPLTIVATGAGPTVDGEWEGWYTIKIVPRTGYVLDGGTTYGIGFTVNSYVGASGALSAWGHAASQYTGQAWTYSSGSWAAHSTIADFTIRFNAEGDIANNIFYNYRGLMHSAVSMGDNGTLISRRGAIAMATSATRDTLTDTGEDFTGWEGRVIKIVAGTGRGQWGTVKSVSSDTLTLDDDWEIIPDATSVYVSPGEWETIGVIDAPVNDVLVVDTEVYFACGITDYIKRYKWSAANGDEPIIDDGTNTAEYLILFRDEDNEPCVWRAEGHEISNSPVADYGTNLSFGTEIRIGSSDSRISSVTVYDDHLYIGKSDAIFAIQEEIVRKIPVDFASLRDENNCRGMLTWNLYLIFPILEGLERLYGTEVDDFGPNTGEGLPSERQGTISAVLPLPGAILVAVDGGRDNMSCVMLYNNLGWHEVARGAWSGQRIQSLWYESYPNGEIYLWWNEGLSMNYAWMSGRVFDRSRDERADYADEGTIITGWMGTDLVDVNKLWSEVIVFGTGMTAVEYKLEDEDEAWATAAQTGNTDTTRTFSLENKEARRIRLKIKLIKGSDGSTPVIDAITVDALGRVSMAQSYQTHFLLENMALSLQNQEEIRIPATILEKMDEWAAEPTALTMTHILPEFDNKTVLLEPVPIRIYEHTDMNTKRVMAITLIEI